MRKGEIAGLTWDCIDFQNNLITVKSTLDKHGHRDSTKSGRIRHVPINDFLKGVLHELFKNRSEASNYVFLSKGNPIDTNHLYRVFGKIQDQAGLENKIRVHDTRHTFASQFMMGGGSLYDLSQILGHTDTKMTQRYAHLSPSHLSKATQSLKFGAESELSKDFTPILPLSILGNKIESNVMVMKACN
jgi:integrase